MEVKKNVPQKSAEVNISARFDAQKRAYEAALTSGRDSGPELLALSQTVALSVLRKVIDPRRNGDDRGDGRASDSGMSPALLALRREVMADLHLLDNTRRAALAATVTRYNRDGIPITETADPAALDALNQLIQERLGDGMDLVQTAALAILEQSQTHATEGAWLDAPHETRRLARQVLIRRDDSAAYRTETVTPIQEAYRAVRQDIRQSRAVQTNATSGYSYIADVSPDGLDTLYRRLHRWADVGGYSHADGIDVYTADGAQLDEMERIMERLGLTARQVRIVWLRNSGYGHKAIARYLGITVDNVKMQVRRIRGKCADMGFTPEAYHWIPGGGDDGADLDVYTITDETDETDETDGTEGRRKRKGKG